VHLHALEGPEARVRGGAPGRDRLPAPHGLVHDPLADEEGRGVERSLRRPRRDRAELAALLLEDERGARPAGHIEDRPERRVREGVDRPGVAERPRDSEERADRGRRPPGPLEREDLAPQPDDLLLELAAPAEPVEQAHAVASWIPYSRSFL